MVYIKIVNESKFPLPEYAKEGDAGMDLRANLEEPDFVLKAGERALISTGIKIALPRGYEAQIRPRSGLALKYGITVLNSPGTIDCNYRGFIGVILYNTDDTDFVIEDGDRIAQIVIARVEDVEWNVQTELDETERGITGFGKSGVK